MGKEQETIQGFLLQDGIAGAVEYIEKLDGAVGLKDDVTLPVLNVKKLHRDVAWCPCCPRRLIHSYTLGRPCASISSSPPLTAHGSLPSPPVSLLLLLRSHSSHLMQHNPLPVSSFLTCSRLKSLRLKSFRKTRALRQASHGPCSTVKPELRSTPSCPLGLLPAACRSAAGAQASVTPPVPSCCASLRVSAPCCASARLGPRQGALGAVLVP